MPAFRTAPQRGMRARFPPKAPDQPRRRGGAFGPPLAPVFGPSPSELRRGVPRLRPEAPFSAGFASARVPPLRAGLASALGAAERAVPAAAFGADLRPFASGLPRGPSGGVPPVLAGRVRVFAAAVASAGASARAGLASALPAGLVADPVVTRRRRTATDRRLACPDRARGLCRPCRRGRPFRSIFLRHCGFARGKAAFRGGACGIVPGGFGRLSQLVAQHAALHLFNLARLHLVQPERAVADADQPVHIKVDRRHGAADLAVLAFAQAHGQPGIRALDAVKRHLHRLEPLPLDDNALAQRLQLGVGRVAVHPHAVLAQPAGRGKLQPPLQLSVVGKQQKPLGVQVQPPDRHHARHVLGQVVEDGVAALLVRRGGDQPLGLVVKPEARGFLFRQRLAAHGDPVGIGHIQRRAVDDAPVHRNLAQFDQPLGLAARGDAAAGKDLGDTLTLPGPGGSGGCFLGHDRKPLRARESAGGFPPPDPRRIFGPR